MIAPTIRLTPAQRLALAEVVEKAVPCCSMEEYEAMAPILRERVRSGFATAEDGTRTPIIRVKSTIVSTTVARTLARLGLAQPLHTHRNITTMIPTKRGRALVASWANTEAA